MAVDTQEETIVIKMVQRCEDDLPGDVRSLLAKFRAIDVSHFPLPMEVTFRAEEMAPFFFFIRISVCVRVWDRNDWETSIWTFFTEDVTCDVLNNKFKSPVGWVRGVLQRIVIHELDECLLVDGRQHVDPHEGGKTGF
jgi:hypothetical protein